LASVIFPTPSVSISLLTVRATDSAAVIVRYSKRCAIVAGATGGPTSYDVRLNGNYGDGFAQLSRRTRTQLVDTIRFLRPLCPQALRVRGEVSAVNFAGAERSRAGGSLWQVIRCSEMTPLERLEVAALLDSFPPGSRRITAGDVAVRLPKSERDVMLLDLLRESKTAADSAKHRAAYANADGMPDQITHIQPLDTMVAMVGFEYKLCFLGRNRYTGAVVIIDGDVDACEAPRVRMQSERSG